MKKNIAILFFTLLFFCAKAQETNYLYADSLAAIASYNRNLPIVWSRTVRGNTVRVQLYEPKTQQLMVTIRGINVSLDKYNTIYTTNSYHKLLRFRLI